MNFADIKSYKKVFILTTIIYGVLLVGISLLSNFYLSKSSIEELSNQKIESTFFEKELLLSQFLDQKVNQVKSIAENNFFVSYISSSYLQNYDYTKELFISLAKSDNMVDEIVYIDNSGQEIIKLSNNGIVFELENQSTKDYFQRFIKLNKNEIGILDIELNKNNGIIKQPLQPIVRFAQAIYQDGKVAGFVMVNIKVNSILNLLKNMELYDLYLIYNNKDYILNPNSLKNWSKDFNISINIQNDFKDYPQVLEMRSFKGNNIISKEIDIFDTNNIKMVIVSKKDHIQEKTNEQKFVIFYIMIGIIILSLPLSYILATIPDNLTKQLKNLNLSLEKKVIQKTYELQELNTKLEDKVKIEVKKNRDKDKILFKQSRQAIMGEVISTIAHHWRQPLSLINTIIANQKIQFILHTDTKENTQNSFNEIEQEIQNLSNIINDFRTFFQPNDKIKDTFEVDKVITDALNLALTSLSNIQVEIIKNFYIIHKITTYRSELSQVLVSVFKNSLEIFELRDVINPTITINSYENENDFVIEILDNGQGIDLAIIDKVFDPYFSTKINKNGTGLGLYISKIIVDEYLTGNISLSNIENGAKITLTIPKV